MKKLIAAQIELLKHATSANKKINEWFFKTGPGQYGHGDEFIGVKVPKIRLVAKTFADLSLIEIKNLLDSPIHEDRLLAVILLRLQYEKSVKLNAFETQKIIFKLYFKNKSRVNNWDLVDSSAPYLTGHYIFHNPKTQNKIFSLVHSKNMWDRRIALLSSFYFIRQLQFKPTIHLVKTLLKDDEDLIHKASGWMLREMGKKDVVKLRKFLDQYSAQMPRTMLRYAIEKLPKKVRLSYLKKPKTLK